MKVYRIEHDVEGIGPYYSDSNLKLTWVMINTHVGFNHPSPEHDYANLGFKLNKEMLFACTSIKVLLKWFEGFTYILLANGFSIYQIEVDDAFVGYSNKQVFFDSKKIKSKLPVILPELNNKLLN